MLFPFSLNGAARIWLEKEQPCSILTWEDLVSKFVNHFFPPSKKINIKNNFTNFQQRFDESFGEAWHRFNDLIRKCPHHGFSELHQIDTFYNALIQSDQDSLNAATGGNLLNRTPRDALAIIENKSYQWNDQSFTPKTAEDVMARERKRKVRTTLLMALPEDHLAKFHKMAYAKEMWEAIKSRFSRNDESKKMQKYLLKQQFEGFFVSALEGMYKGYDRFQTLLSQLEIHSAGVLHEDVNQKFLRSLPSSWSQVALIMKTKPWLDTLSFDDLYNNLRVFKRDVKGNTTSSSNTQNMAFVSFENTSNTNDINDDDMEEMDLKWQFVLDKTKVECFNCHKIRRFARDHRAKRNQDSRRRDVRYNGNKARDNGRRPAYQDDLKALVTIDGEDIDWSGYVEEDAQNYAMMAYSSSNSGSDNEDNVELIMRGSGKSLQQKKKELFDEYERFRAIGNESIHDYFVRFYKLINVIKITQLDILAHQMNTKFVNNLPPYWAKYVTNLKNNKDISATTYVELYTYLKSYEPHPMKTLNKQEQSSSIIKALGNIGNTGTRGTQSYGQVTDNKGKLVICYKCHGEGHVSRQCKEKKRVKDSQYFKDKMLLMEAKEKGVVLYAEAEAFLADVECTAPYGQPLAITTTNIFKVSHEDVYDSDVDKGPHAVAAFMAILPSTSGTNGSSNPWYAKQNKIAQPTLYDGHALLKPTNTPVRVHDSEESLDQAEKSNPPKPVTPFVYTRPAPSKVCTQLLKLKDCFPAFETIIKRRTTLTFYEQGEWRFVHTKKDFIEQVIPFYEHVKELVQSLDENLVKKVTEFIRIFDELDKKENSKVIELEAEILKQQQMLAESDKRCSFIQKSHIDLQIKFRNYKECLKNQMIGDNSHSPAVNAVFEINQLKEQLQGKDDTIKKLQTQINSMSMLNIEPTVGVKPATGASKPMSKSDTQNHSILPAKREKARRVEDHHRNLNKQNHIDSRLNVKHTGFVSNSNTVCNACNKSLFFANHDNCVVRNLKYVNVKTPTVKHNVKTTKKVWKETVVTVRSQWKPTGRHSGCSRHMTDNRSKLTNYVDKFIGTVRFENDQFAAIVGYGDYKLGNTIISRVYYVEGLSHNLFLVGQFCDGGLKVAFRQHTCHIRNNDMVDLLQGKSKKSSHPLKTVNTNTKILNTLHMDLYGPMRIESMNKKKYILVIVDDYTKFGWVRFLRTKDETPEVIKKFIVTTQRALNAIVRYVRTDNGTEFVNKTLTEFFENIGIFVGYAPTKKAYRVFSKRTRLEPNTMAPVYNGAGPEISALQSGRTRSDLANDPTTPSKHPVRINAAQAPEIATGSPSTMIIIESAPAIFTTSLESQTPPPDTGVTGIETPFHTCDNNVFEPYIASEASSSDTLNVE
nr:reverse transcriptase domain-containing protein [Tanacetum cinerariifolium]